MFLREFLNGKSDKLCLLNHVRMNLKENGPFHSFLQFHHNRIHRSSVKRIFGIRINSSGADSNTKRNFGFINVHFKIRDFIPNKALKSRIFDLQPFTRRITQNHHPTTHIRHLAYFLFFRRSVIIRKNWFVDLHIFVRMKLIVQFQSLVGIFEIL